MPSDPDAARQIRVETGMPQPVAKILAGMGFLDGAAIDHFMNPRLGDLSDPFRLPDMALAVERIWRAIEQREAVVVYGDYDVDGITSAALLIQILLRLGAAEVSPCLPSRLSEGYGLSIEALQRCFSHCKPRLLITVDCGTNAVESAQFAIRSGVDVIVTDHHEVSGDMSAVTALVNPKRVADDVIRGLAGVGVVFKLCHALIKGGRERQIPEASTLDLRDYLDLAAVGTVADIVPLLGENRILVRHGLDRLNRTESVGLNALMTVAGIRRPVEAWHIGFMLGPRLNAAGRMGDAESALELLLTDYEPRAKEIAAVLDGSNRDRQDIESKIIAEAVTEIDAWFDPSVHYGIVVGRPGWHSGVIGIVASRLAFRYRRPVAVIAFDPQHMGRGSCRSIEGYNVLKGLERCAACLTTFGGHEMAAGFELDADHFEAFKASFNAAAADLLQGQDLRPVQRINAWLNLEEADDALLDCLDRLGPFGQSNPTPVLAVRGVTLSAPPRKIGRNHLGLTLATGLVRRNAIAFGMADREIPSGPLDIAFQLQRNTYQGVESIQLNLQDFRPAQA